MKKIISFAAVLLAIITLASCKDKNEIEETVSGTAAAVSAPVAAAASAEEPTAVQPIIDRSYEKIYENNKNLTPVDYSNPALLPLSEDMGQEYIDKLMIICDSQHFWMKPFGYLKDGDKTKSIITGPEDTMTLTFYRELELVDPYDGKLKNVVDIIKEHKPGILIIALGLNGIATSDGERFRNDYAGLIKDLQKASPETEIICESILPIMPTFWNWEDINNAKITECNSWILKIAGEHGCRYLDTYGVIADEQGNADPELMMDSLHANMKGLKKVIDYWKTHALTEHENYIG